MAEYLVRDNCRLCCNQTLDLAVSLPPTVPGEHLKQTLHSQIPDPIPIDLYQCSHCGHVQIVHVPPPEVLFGDDYTFMPSLNPILIKHFESSVAHFINEHKANVNFAFEIGSNDGLFLTTLRKMSGCRVLGIDPSVKPVEVAKSNNVETILDYFTPKIAAEIVEKYGRPDLIIANNVFAHIDDLRGVLKALSGMLAQDGYFMFEASYLKDVVDNYLIGTIIHEHLSIHSIYSLVPFLEDAGLTLVDLTYTKHVQGGAIIGIAQNSSRARPSSKIEHFIQEEHALGITNLEGMKLFESRLNMKISTLKNELRQLSRNKTLVGYGAARSATLIIDLLGLGNQIKYIVDDHPMKIGKYMPIGNIPIISTDQHKSSADNIFIVLGWAQHEKIIKSIKSINERCLIVTVFPQFEVLT